MIQRIIKTTFKLRRGHTEALREQNVLPSQGEPIFDIDLNKLKIGDGVKHYNELEYIGKSVITANSVEEFPVQGDSECLYIAADPESIYRFDAISKTYVPLYADALSNKVDKVEGKELSSNDFTDDYKSKLEGIQTGAEVNVQPDWAQNDETAVDYIKNKPTVDQTYSSTSENAQSGKAVAESIKDMPTNLVNGSSYGSLRTIRAKTMLGTCAFAEGYNTTASGSNSHAEGDSTTASGTTSHAEGFYTTASGSGSHAEGGNTKASEIYSHAEGNRTTASGGNSHAEGYNTKASGSNSHAEGGYTTASGDYSHSEGNSTTASGINSHAEGGYTTASGGNSHAEGYNTKASDSNSHAEGYNTKASGSNSHAEGSYTIASGNYSHVEGYGTQASGVYSHVQGRYNVIDNNNKYADIIGNGSSDTERSNAATVDWNGNGWYAGDVYVGSTSGTNRDEGSKKLATEIYTNTVSANVIKNSVSGLNVVQITDKNNNLSPVTHEMGVKVRKVNLFDISKITNTASLTNNGDGTITIAANSYSSPTGESLKELCPDLKIGDIITLSAITESDVKFIYLQTSQREIRFGKYTTITQNDLDSHVVFYGHKSASEKYGTPCIISNIQIELGSTATAYTPYVSDLTAVKVSRYGKNLFDASKVQNATLTTYMNKPCLSYVDGANYFIYTDNFIKDTQYTFTTKAYREDGVINKPIYFYLRYTDGTNQLRILDSGAKGSVTSTAGKTLARIEGGNTYGLKCYIDLSVTQLELGTTATYYEPYITPTDYTPTADGIINGVTSLYPNTTLMTDTDGVLIDCEYNADTKKYVDTKVDDVQINGASIVENGVANIPFVKVSGDTGVVKIYGAGLQIIEAATGRIGTAKAVNAVINSRQDNYSIICPSNLDYAVKAAMCDGKGTAWTEIEQQAAMDRIGITDIIGDINTALDSIIEMQNSLIGGN